MKMKTLIAALTLSVGGLTMAQTPLATTPKNPLATPGLDKRETNQQKRINQGVTSGQLSAKETNRLEKREIKLNADEAAAEADGKVTHSERMKLQHEANKDSKAIHRQEHNKQTAST